jgi:RNA polymerase sigma-70 factor (ECF subfamily)
MNDTSKPSDGELLAVFAGTNDEAAFAELIGRHGAMVQGVCLRVLGNFHEAQDVTQAVFVTLARKAASLRKDPSVGGWLHHVAICLARNVRAANHSRQRREEQAMHEIEVTAEPCVVDSHALRAELDDAIGRLPERYRLPLVLFHLEERSLEQTAQALALNIKTASTRLVRGREMLRKKLIRRGVTAGAIGALTTLLSAEAGAAVLPATFISATVQAASLAATGKLAAGVGTGVVSAKVAALTKGAIQMMFIAQLKTAALITAACVVVAGGGAVVAKEMLTPPAAPATAQAEPKGLPPPTPATNDTATIAWGAVTNELQAGLVPLAEAPGVPLDGPQPLWSDGKDVFFCPKCARKPRKGCMDPSAAADKRVCAVCQTPKPWSATFIEGRPMRMELHFKNLAKEERSLFDVRYAGNWSFTFTPVGGGKVWKTIWSREDERRMEGIAQSTIKLAVGQQDAEAMGLERHSLQVMNPDYGRQPANPGLPPGKYTVTASYAHPGITAVGGIPDACAGHENGKPCTYWRGTVTTGPVEIEIKQAVGCGLAWEATDVGVGSYEKAVKLLGRNGFAVIYSAEEKKVFWDRLYEAGSQVLVAEHTGPKEPWEDFERGMQVVCWRDLTAADSLRITGVQQTAGGGSGKRDKFRLDLEVKQNNADRHARDWKACCVWIPRVASVEVSGSGKDGKEEIWTADKKGRDVADGLQACLEVKQTTIKPGDDITLTMTLRNVRPAGGDPIRVWDNTWSAGYRADFYLVVTPDGQSHILRRAVQEHWKRNAPTPITIAPGKSWTLDGVRYEENTKSLKSLGLDTAKEGIYTITGYYEAEGRQAGVEGTNGLFWGGQIATPPVEVRVGATNAPAAKVTEADARRIALAKATDLYPKWQEHHNAATYGDALRKATLADGIWTVEFSADNGLTGWSATIRIDAQTGKALSAEKHDGA